MVPVQIDDAAPGASAPAVDPVRRQRDLALGLTALLPGLGHLVYGSRFLGTIYLLLSLVLLAVGLLLLVLFGKELLLRGTEWRRPLLAVAVVMIWGIAYGATLLWDARLIPGKQSPSALAASLLQAAVFIAAIWFIMVR